MIAVQGPNSENILQQFCDIDLSEMSLRDVRLREYSSRRA